MASTPSVDLSILRVGIPAELPAHPGNHPDPTVPKAPHRNIDGLSKDDLVLAVQNALRYFPRSSTPRWRPSSRRSSRTRATSTCTASAPCSTR